MLFSLGHGQHIVADTGTAPRERAFGRSSQPGPQVEPDAVPLARVLEEPSAAPLARSRAAMAPQDDYGPGLSPGPGAFHYYFPDAPRIEPSDSMVAALDKLADTMVEPAGDPGTDAGGAAINSAIAPVFTYLGQFIDHDITANTDREGGISVIGGDCAPQARADVEAQLDNLRDGSLALDSLYGDSPGQGAFATKLAGLMRHPTLTAKMRLGVATVTPARPPLPADPAADLLRLGFLLNRGDLTLAELQALDPAIRAAFLDDAGNPVLAHAIIGDDRNDENLIVAQLHVAFLRLHNVLTDRVAGGGFEEARRMTRFHYQWLVVNSYLPTVCDPAWMSQVLSAKAPLYAKFFADHSPAESTKMPLPLEFSVAAFRFGHSMVRGSYDHNRIFGTPVAGTPGILPNAPFNFLFSFTGGGGMATPTATDKGEALPDNWIIEWERFITSDQATRAARKIDTHLAPPLADLFKEHGTAIFKHLAQRNLRRGYRLSIPTGQGCIAAINALGIYGTVPDIPHDRIFEGHADIDPALATATPLWYYVLREAEMGGGNHLGPLGSILVADTLLGLLINDPGSYWNAGSGGAPWAPTDFNSTDPIDSLDKMLRFIGML